MKDVSSRLRNFLFIFASILLFAPSVFSASYTTYQAKIVKPDGYPLEANNVNFKFTILDQAGSCILYSETYNAVNMTNTSGLISFSLGSGVKTYPASSPTFFDIFNNGVASHSCDVGGPASYSPGANDTRKIVMQFHDGSGWQTLPAMTINAVPYAMYANDSQKLGGVSATSYVRYSTIPTCTASEALQYTGASFNCVTLPTAGAFTAGDVAAALSYTPANAASVTSLNSEIGNVSSTVSAVSSTVYAVSSTVNSLTSNLSSLQNSVAVSLAAITSSQWVTSGSAVHYNAGNVVVSGGLQISMEAAACSANLAGTLRYNLGAVEYCNGVLWAAFGVSGAGLQGLNGSASGTQSFAIGTAGNSPAFATANGVHTLNIPLASAGSVTGGLLSNADYSTFMNKITSSAASIAQVLGYTPASATALANYLTKASNLSDLASSATARTNLGVGYIGTLASVDLGSADVSGTLAIARTPSYLGDVTKASASNTLVLSNTGVVAGTYNKVTVDAKGRVTSSSALTSSDVTTALGFTPGAAASGVTLLNGSASQTQTFAVGTTGTAPLFSTANGVHTLNIPLASAGSVTGGLLSNADYSTFMNKITSSAASIAQVLGYTPASATALGSYVVRANNLSDLASSATARTNLGVGYIGTLASVDLGSADVSGTLAIARTPSYVGDVTKASASNTLVLSNTGVVAGTYNKVTVDAKGRVTSSSALTSSDVTTALGFTPGAAASGVNLLNGSASQTQTFAVGTTGTAPLFNTANGVHTLNIPLASAGSVTGGLLSNADYSTFMNKITSSAASIAQVLGYTPASATALGSYVVRANNLSDLASSATARTNLGLGTLATLSFVDLGSAQASGTLAEARLANVAGVTSGTQYTKVTVDGKGRVISGAQLSTGDVTTALGYTPASASASTQWTTNGSSIYYNTGSVGIGANNPASKLLVTYDSTVNGIASAAIVADAPGITTNDYSLLLRSRTGPNLVSNTFTVRGDGRVGIGTTNPSAYLSMYKDSGIADDLIRLRDTTDAIDFAVRYNGVNAYEMRSEGSGLGYLFFNLASTGQVGVGMVASTNAKMQIVSGTSTLAPLRLTSGTLLSSPASGAIEYDGFYYYITDGANTRRAIATVASPGTFDNANTISSTGNITMVPVGSVVVSSTTASTNSQTGALVVKGGLGIAGNTFSSGTIITSSNMQGASITATSGMIAPYIAGSVASAGSLILDSTTHATKGKILMAPNGGFVGIGTSNPTSILTIAGAAPESTVISQGSESVTLFGNGSAYYQGRDVTNDIEFIMGTSVASEVFSGSMSAHDYSLRTGNATRMYLKHSNGFIGVGTTVPAAKLQVSGGAIMPSWGNASTAGIQFPGNPGGGTSDEAFIRYYVESGESTKFMIGTDNDATDTIGFWQDGAERMTLYSGKVGIGTSTPTQLLEVSGTAKANAFIGDGSGLTNISAANMTFNNYVAGYPAGAPTSFSQMTQGLTGWQDYTGNAMNLGSAYWAGLTSRNNNTGLQFAVNWNNGGGTPSGFKVRSQDDNVGNWGTWRDVAFVDATVNKAGDTMTGPLVLPSNGLSVGTDQLVVSGTNVGIGTAVPDSALNVVGTGGGDDDVHVDSYTNAAEGTIMLRRARGTVASPLPLSSGDRIGFYTFRGYDGSNFLDLARIQSTTESDFAVASASANLAFTTTYNGSNSEKMRISASGAVGVGTTTPTAGYRMDVFGDMQLGHGGSAQMLRFRTANTDSAFIRFNSTADSAGNSSLEIGTLDNNDEPITFTQSGNERMRIHTNGFVGIGSATPAATLQVQGGIRARGGLPGANGVSNTGYAFGTGGDNDSGMFSSADGLIQFYSNNAEAMRIESGGQVGIGGSPDDKFYVNNGTSIGRYTTGGWTHVSDRRYKHDISTIEDSLNKILQLRGVQYTFNNDPKNKMQLGFIAQEVEPIFPQVVETDKKGYKSMIYANLVAPVVESIKALYQRILGIEEKVQQQAREIAMLKEKSDQLEQQNKVLKEYLCEKDPSAKICK